VYAIATGSQVEGNAELRRGSDRYAILATDR
jgi:hypothetical protein